MPRAAYVYNDQLSRHVLREDHPLQPRRLRMTYELLQSYGAFQQEGALLVEPRLATPEELLLVHDAEYVDAVRSISNGEGRFLPARYGFSLMGDNPPYPGMYEAALLATGASLVAAELVAQSVTPIAFSTSGGLHHAARDRASGFCVFNDPAIAIAALVRLGMRVAYVDIDAHHGDGVQQAFYGTDQVLSISIHESGQYLFPGTGEPGEVGAGQGRGYSVNVPLLPYTGDGVYLSTFEAVVPPLLSAFHPDVLVLQLGVDAHFLDSLSHLRLTSSGYQRVLQQLLGSCPRIVAMGGGGYHLTTVARVWSLEYGQMLGTRWPEALPDAFRNTYGGTILPDAPPPPEEADLVMQTQAFAEQQVAAVQRLIFPVHGL